MVKTSSSSPFPILLERVQKSPFKTIQKVKQILVKYYRHESIGFTYTSSLKSMGLIPRQHGLYQLGKKYVYTQT